MSARETPPTVVEFVDTTPWRADRPKVAHKAREVRVNGRPVLVARDGIRVWTDPTGFKATEVTLTLLPSALLFVWGDGTAVEDGDVDGTVVSPAPAPDGDGA